MPQLGKPLNWGVAVKVIGVTPVPSAFIVYTCKWPSIWRWNAIRSPVGEQAGFVSWPGKVVNRVFSKAIGEWLRRVEALRYAA